MSFESSSKDFDYIGYVENRVAIIEGASYDTAERIREVEERVDNIEILTERFVDGWVHDKDICNIREEINDFKRQLISELVAEIAATFKREFCIDYGPADEQEFLQNIQYLYT